MLKKIEDWIDQTLDQYSEEKVSCKCLFPAFEGFHSQILLSNSYFVITDELPKPDFPEIHDAGLGDFIKMDVDGITYKNTYFLKTKHKRNLELHFHELVHVLQWKYLGSSKFLARYISEIQRYGYNRMPLEQMAYKLEHHFSNKGPVFDISDYVKKHL